MQAQVIDNLIQDAEKLWKEKFIFYMKPESVEGFKKDITLIVDSYISEDYINALNITHENYLGFLGLTDTADVNKTGFHSFPMKEIFRKLYIKIAKMFIEEKIGGAIEQVDNYEQCFPDATLIVINPYQKQFKLVRGLNKKMKIVPGWNQSKKCVEGVSEVDYFYPKEKLIVNLDNDGKIVFSIPSPVDEIIDKVDYNNGIREGLVYVVKGKLI
jgi:hypothetical protein